MGRAPGELIGLISASDVTAWIQREEELEELGEEA